MPLVIHCPSCAKRYQVADKLAGKQVRCQQCGTTFAAQVAASSAARAPLSVSDPLAGINLAQLPAAPVSALLQGGANPLGKPDSTTAGNYASAASYTGPTGAGGVSNPSGGPPDGVMRAVSGGMLGLGLFLTVASIVAQAMTSTLYIGVIVLAPLTIVLGIAGLISPNVVRAAGKYGGHLPWQYKAIGLGLVAVSVVISMTLVLLILAVGFRP